MSEVQKSTTKRGRKPKSEKEAANGDSEGEKGPRRSGRGATSKDEEQPVQKEKQGGDASEKVKRGRKPKAEGEVAKKVQALGEDHDLQQLQDIAHQLRIHSIEMTQASNSGHPTSCASIAEVLSVLFFDPSGMHYSAKNPRNFLNDRFVLSKGHAAPILYAAWSVAGLIEPAELLRLRQIDCDLEGHPTPRLDFVDIATGSLGQGVSVAGGMAYASKYLDKLDNRYYVLIGDGESAEGSVWEACNLASHYKLDNLTLIVDVNRLGQSEETGLQHHTEVYEKRFSAFGFHTQVVDGHNLTELVHAFSKARDVKGQPQAIVAKTFKGKYFPDIEDKVDWHGKPLTNDKLPGVISHLKSLQKTTNFTLHPKAPAAEVPYPEFQHFKIDNLTYAPGSKVATRRAYGTGLVALSKSDDKKQIVAIDGDTKNSTFSLLYKQAVPTNFVECYIAEQNMVGWGQGLAQRSKVVFASTFGAFFSRAYDQIRMGGVSHNQLKFVGSHSGVSIGEDGPSQMALEDFAMFRAVPNTVVLYPSDGISAERAVEIAANHRGSVYIRTSRPDATTIYEATTVFNVGQSHVVHQGDNDSLVIVAGGVTLHEALHAQKALQSQGVGVTVIDIFSVKPFDKNTVLEAARKTTKRLVLTVEDHYLQGGLFETVASGLAAENDIRVFGVGVTGVPRSGKPHELLALYGLDASSIQNKVLELQ